MRKWTGCDWQRRRTQPERSDFKIVRWITWEVWWRPEGMDSPIPSDGLANAKRKNTFLEFRKRWRWFIWSAWMRKLWKDGRVGMPHVIYCQKQDHYQARTKQLWTWQVKVKDLWVAEEIRKISTKRKSASNYCKLSAWSVCFFCVSPSTSRYLLSGTDSRMEAFMAQLINYGCKLPYAVIAPWFDLSDGVCSYRSHKFFSVFLAVFLAVFFAICKKYR